MKYTFDWGDGTISATSLVSSGTAASASHSWTVASGTTKTFSVKAKATDEEGLESSWSSPLSVTIKGPATTDTTNSPPRAPRAPIGKLMGDTRYSYTYETVGHDPEGDAIKYTFDWGDGTTSTTGYVASGTYASATHKWSGIAPGDGKAFTLKAMATDSHGTQSVWSQTVNVIMCEPYVNYPPANPVLSGPAEVESGVPARFTVVSTDPNEVDKIRYVIHWGDATNTETDFYPSGQKVTVYHTWNVPAGITLKPYITAIAVDQRNQASDYFSNALKYSITGLASETSPLIYTQKSGLESEAYDSMYMQTEGAGSDMQANESDSDEVPIEEAVPLDELFIESESVDVPIEEELPFVMDDEYSMASNGSVLEISNPTVLENDQYWGDKSLSVTSYTQPAHAADFFMNPDGSFAYTRTKDYCGEDSFTYRVTDGDWESNMATVTIYIDCDIRSEEEMTY